jgi:hypothetical protein
MVIGASGQAPPPALSSRAVRSPKPVLLRTAPQAPPTALLNMVSRKLATRVSAPGGSPPPVAPIHGLAWVVLPIVWGTGLEVPVWSYYSGLQFYGSYVPFEDSSVPQYFGNLVYSNGSSNADTIIFGATYLSISMEFCWAPIKSVSHRPRISIKEILT